METSFHPKKLYKCISFSNNYWSYIGQENKIRFATISELLSGNDKTEFIEIFNNSISCFEISFDKESGS